MIRRARYRHTQDSDGGADVRLILQLLQSAPNPPNETPDSIGAILSDEEYQFCYVDTTRRTCARLVVGASAIAVPWWLPRAKWTEDNFDDLVPVMARTAVAVLSAHPDKRNWKVFGDPQFPDDVPEAERQQKSRDINEFWKARLAPYGVTVGEEEADNQFMVRGYATLIELAGLPR